MKKPALLIIIVLSILFFILFQWDQIMHSKHLAIQQEIQKVREFEINRRSEAKSAALRFYEKINPPIPDHENGALILQNASDLVPPSALSKLKDSRKKLSSPETLSESDWITLRETLEQCEPLFDQFRKLASFDRFKYSLDIEAHIEGEYSIPYITKLTTYVQALESRGLIHLHQNNLDQVLDTIQTLNSIQTSLRNELYFNAVYLKWAITNTIYSLTQSTLISDASDAKILEFLTDLPDRFFHANDMTNLIHSHRLICLNNVLGIDPLKLNSFDDLNLKHDDVTRSFNALLNLSPKDISDPASPKLMEEYITHSILKDIQQMDSQFQVLLKLVAEPYTDHFWNRVESMAQDLKSQGHLIYNGIVYPTSKAESFLKSSSPDALNRFELFHLQIVELPLLTAAQLEFFHSFALKHCLILGRQHNIQAARMLFQFAADSQQPFPDNLSNFPEDFQANWPIDPFSGNPLAYRFEGNQICINFDYITRLTAQNNRFKPAGANSHHMKLQELRFKIPAFEN